LSKFRNLLKTVFLEEFFNDLLFYNLLKKQFGNVKSVLELGAGKDSYMNFKDRDYKITALDLHKPSIEKSKKQNNFDEYILGDAREVTDIFRDRSFDLVTSFDLIEHFEKDEGYKLLDDMIKVSKKKIIIFTPNGFVPQLATADNPFQEHKSGWTYKEMKKLGFKVYGINGFKKLRGMYAVPKIKPRELGWFVCNMSQIFLKLTRLNKFCYTILCVKEVSK
jgi:ubiquinone/menaquinone biosynthesis C-methylase UbiE